MQRVQVRQRVLVMKMLLDLALISALLSVSVLLSGATSPEIVSGCCDRLRLTLGFGSGATLPSALPPLSASGVAILIGSGSLLCNLCGVTDDIRRVAPSLNCCKTLGVVDGWSA